MEENKPQGAEGTDGTVGEDSPYQLAVSQCRTLMTEGKKDEASDSYNEAFTLNTDAENEELSLLSDQLDKMEEGKPFEFPESEAAEEGKEEYSETEIKALENLDDEALKALLEKLTLEVGEGELWREEGINDIMAHDRNIVAKTIKELATPKGGEETELESLPEWHDKAGQQLETDELKKILKEELSISFNMLTGRKKLQKKFDDYNAEKGYVKSEEDVKAEESKDEEEKDEKSTVKKDKRGKKAKTVTLDDCIEDCQKAVMTLQQMEKQERANGKSSRRFRRAWQTINGQVIKKSLRRK